MSHPPDVAEFLCGRCRACMCDDCKSIAAEYEFLYVGRTWALSAAESQVQELTREVERLRRRAEGFEQVAKMGFNELMLGYIDSLAEKVIAEIPAEERERSARIERSLNELDRLNNLARAR